MKRVAFTIVILFLLSQIGYCQELNEPSKVTDVSQASILDNLTLQVTGIDLSKEKDRSFVVHAILESRGKCEGRKYLFQESQNYVIKFDNNFFGLVTNTDAKSTDLSCDRKVDVIVDTKGFRQIERPEAPVPFGLMTSELKLRSGQHKIILFCRVYDSEHRFVLLPSQEFAINVP